MPLTSLIPIGAWLWDKYGETVTDKTAGAVKEGWHKFKWHDAAEKYRAKIKKLYGTMQIMGMAEPVPLDDIFTEAYMLDKPTAFGRFDIERLKQLAADPNAPPNAERINGLRLVKEKGNLFILGKPGAGKTTFLKYIALKAAEQLIDKVPIFISLKQWADSGAELMPFIRERFDICDFPDAQPFVEELLKSGNAIVLFDGLDEVNQESGQRDKQTRQMNNFVEKYDRTQCLITCRLAASDYSFERFIYVEIADFTENQIKTFVGNWFRNQAGEKDEETCQKFLTEFARADNEGLRDLARSPLLLTLLCLAFNETLTFPQRRVEIYQEALDALLKKWDSSRRIKRDEVYRKLSLGHKENMLARIAAETFERNEYFIPQAELERYITNYVKNIPPHDTNETADGESILKTIEAQHGIFVERAREIYSFSHLTFQEYFTAKYIVANSAKGTLTNLISAHCADERWREVFLLTTSLLPDAGQFIKSFRCSVNKLLEDDEKLKTLLLWADKTAPLLNPALWLFRLGYLFIEFYYRLVDNKLAHALSLAYNRDSSLRHILATELDLMLDLAFARNLALAHDIIFDLDLNHDYALALAFDLQGAIKDTRDLSLGLGLDTLAEDLTKFSLPSEKTWDDSFDDIAEELTDLNHKATAAEWQACIDELRTLMIKHRDIGHKWDLTSTQEAQLANYINATELLRDCLQLATMPPEEKKAMLNSLYLPPVQAGEGQEA